VALTAERAIGIEDFIERVVHALDHGEPWSIVRWADSKNWLFGEKRAGEIARSPSGATLAYREGRLSVGDYEALREASIAGLTEADVHGMFVGDTWTTDVLRHLGLLDLLQPLVNPWCHLYCPAYREWNDEVMAREQRVVLVGNRMEAYMPLLAKWFPQMKVIQCWPAGGWPDVQKAAAGIEAVRPAMVMGAAGWFTAALALASKRAGAVFLDVGHTPDAHLAPRPQFVPNLAGDRGMAGAIAHIDSHGNCPHQLAPTRDIEFAWRDSDA